MKTDGDYESNATKSIFMALQKKCQSAKYLAPAKKMAMYFTI